LENTIECSPVLFLKLAEDSIGEYDLVFTPQTRNPTTPSYFINTTELDKKIGKQELVTGLSPRWIMVSEIFNSHQREKNSSTVMLIIDSKKEKEIGLGRGWTHESLSGYKCHVAVSLLRLLHVNPNSGENITVRFDVFTLLHTLSGSRDTEIHFIRSLISQAVVNSNSPDFNVTGAINWQQILPGVNSDTLNTLLQNPVNQQLLDVYLLQYLGISSFNDLADLSDDQIYAIKDLLAIEVDLTVVDAIDLPMGKYPDTIGNSVIIEIDLWNEILRNAASRSIANITGVLIQNVNGLPLTDEQKKQLVEGSPLLTTLNTYAATLDIREYALTVIVMYKNRFSTFLKDKRELENDIVLWSNDLMDILGVDYPVLITAPLIQALRILYYLRLFLDQLLLLIEVFLVGLGMLLIYSLLLADVEGKVYECGMLRALGMQQYNLIQLLVIQSLLFSVPGIMLGLVIANLLFIPIGSFFSSFSLVPISLVLSWKAIGLGVGIGFVMPLVALIGPVQTALSKTLRDALDLYHSLSSDTIVQFVSLEKLGISATQTYLSLLGVAFGFIVYYLIPYSFIFFYWGLFFNIFVIILVSMVLGLALLGMIFHPFAQRLSVLTIMWGPDRKLLKPLVEKNLSGHGRRNSKTSILYTICIAFIIFAGTIFSQQAHSLEAKAKIGVGGDIVITALRFTLPLDHISLSKYLDREMKRPGTIVKGYSFCSFPLSQLPESPVARTDIASLADFAAARVLIYGVDRNFLDVAYDEFVDIKELDNSREYTKTPNGNNDIIKSIWDDISPPEASIRTDIFTHKSNLYTDKWYANQDVYNTEVYTHPIDVIVSEATRLPTSIDTNMPVELRASVAVTSNGRFTKNTNYYFLGRIRAMASSMPGFLLSSYPQTAVFSPVIISMDQFRFLQAAVYNVSYVDDPSKIPKDPLMKSLFIKVDESSSILERDDVINALKTFINDDLIFIVNTKEILKSTDTAILILNVFFYVVSIIIIILCFFLLFVSFTTNVNENAWEFGVLRAIGMTAFQVIRVYMYEALAIVLASVFIGFIIGDLVSVTLTLQACLFSELPFTFNFPTILFFSVVGMSVIVAVLGSYLPARVLQKKRIASALKNL